MSKYRNHFTPEQEQFLRDNYFAIGSYDLLTEAFNHEFGTNRSQLSVRQKCTKQLGLKGVPNPAPYRMRVRNLAPIGSIRKTNRATYIKVLHSPTGTYLRGYEEPYWVPLQKKIYQDAHGEIPPGKMVCFLDGNINNFDLDNLYCIDRQILAIMSANRWWSKSKVHTLTAIKWCELHFAIKDVGGDAK